MAKKFQLQLIDWSAWSSTLQDKAAWQHWDGQVPKDNEQQTPHASNIPAMQRRRCSRLTKMALHVADEATQNAGVEISFSLFCSRHGELHRTLGLLEHLAANEELSPMAFAQSVHNTASGLHGIVNQTFIPSTSIAAHHHLIEQGWIEAFAYLTLHPTEHVLLVVFDETVPSTYEDFVEQKDDIALALILGMDCSIPSRTTTLIKHPADSNVQDSRPSLSSPWQFMQTLTNTVQSHLDSHWTWQIE